MRQTLLLRIFIGGLISFSLPLFGQQKTITQRETMRIPGLQSGGSLGIDLRRRNVPVGIFEAPLGGNTSINGANTDLSHITIIDGGGSSSHATTVAEILTSKGLATPSRLGVAPNASVYLYGRELGHESWAVEVGNSIDSYNLLLSNHSYVENNGWATADTFWVGVVDMSDTEDYKFGYYGDYSRTMDSLMYEYPYHLMVKAIGNDRGQSNASLPFTAYSTPAYSIISRSSPIPEDDGGIDGYDCLSRDATSKNALIIGAVNNIFGGYSVPGDISFANSSSAWGLTDDGRVKPDLVGPGQLTTGTAYTSYAAPMITGLGALLQELNRKQNGRWMKSSTLKALLIHTADAGTSNGAPLATMGWGIPNAESAGSYLLNSDGNQRIIEGEIENGETLTFRFYHDGTSDFRATMAWTDPHGTSPTLDFTSSDLDDSTAILVHDLDMELWEETGTPSLHASPWKMSAANPGHSAWCGDNNVDNVERIDFPAASMPTFFVISLPFSIIETVANASSNPTTWLQYVSTILINVIEEVISIGIKHPVLACPAQTGIYE